MTALSPITIQVPRDPFIFQSATKVTRAPHCMLIRAVQIPSMAIQKERVSAITRYTLDYFPNLNTNFPTQHAPCSHGNE